MAAKRRETDGAEEILRFVDRHGTVDKDKETGATQRGSRGRGTRVRRGVVDELDLHGCTEEEARRRLRSAAQRCRETGRTVLRVIHGRGLHSAGSGPVLKTMVLQMLAGELGGVVRDWVGASPREGGEGVTVVRFR